MDLPDEEMWVVISDVKAELEEVKWVWRVEVWAEREDREDTAEERVEIDDRRE